MVSRFAFLTVLLLVAPAGLAAPIELHGATPGQELLIPLPSEECGAGSEAPCPKPGDAKAGATAVPGADRSTSPGAAAKAFKLPDLDGRTYAFNPQGSTKPTLLIFWSLFCAPCKEEFPLYGQLSQEYGAKGLEVVAVNLDANLESARRARTAKSYLKMMKASLRVVLDRKEGGHFLAADPYGVDGTPSLFVIDRGGTIRWAHAGRVPPEQLRAAIRQVLGI